MSISKRLRFEVLRRDNHACRYCGGSAPDAKLTVDHVIPVALGGSDEPSNLVAACDACNSGKSATPADAATVDDVAADAVRWARAMAYAAGVLMADRVHRAETRARFREAWDNWAWPDREGARHTFDLPRDWESSVDSILSAGLPVEVLRECVDIAFTARSAPKDPFRYMCGTAWRKVAEMREIAGAIIDSEDGA
jgi:hypothetical protein